MGLNPRPGDIAQARAIAAQKRRERTVFGENAAEKARTPVVQAARETVDQIIQGDVRSTPAAERLRKLGLSHAEKADVESYSRARSKQSLRDNDFQEQAAGFLIGPDLAKLLPGGTPAREASLKGVALDAALLAPGSLIGRPLGFGFRGAKKAVGTTAKAAPPAGAEKLIESLPEAKRLRRQQEAGYSAERGKRAAKAEQAMQIGGEEGYRAALSELKGELPKLKFGALEQFDQAAADELFSHVQKHPDLRPFEKINTQTALKKVLDGSVPTRSEIRLLERTFGAEVAGQIRDSITFWRKAKNLGFSLINVPRSIRASYDLSAPFRQGLVLGARHPRIFSREFAPMLKSFRSESAYEDVMDDIASRATFPTMQKAKLQLTDLEGLSTREEAFMSNLAEQIPVIGRGVRASGRAYTAFLNKFRADAFDNYLRMAEDQGLDITDQKLVKDIARWVNHATGRGSVKSLEGAMVPLNALLFSPRLIASRLQLLNPAFYATLDPFARKQALRGMAQMLGGISLTLWLAKQAGAEVGLDPRSSDFGKIKVGDTRVDVAGGFQQYLVAASRFVKGESMSSTTGAVTTLEGGFAKPSRADILANFAENKLAPVPTYAVDFAKNENFAGDEFDPLKEGARAFTPLGLENAYEGFNVGGPGAGVTSLGLGSIGFGVQTYQAKPPKAATKDYKEALKTIAQDVQKGNITEADAKEFRALARARYEQEWRARQLEARGLKDEQLNRQLVIDDGIRQDRPLATINDFLAATGYPPTTTEEIEKTERELLRLDVQVGK